MTLLKSNAEWQKILLMIRSKEVPPIQHVGPSFFLFRLSYVARKNIWDKYCIYWLWLIRDIADHHGKLSHL